MIAIPISHVRHRAFHAPWDADEISEVIETPKFEIAGFFNFGVVYH
jgi:hypothetical protein